MSIAQALVRFREARGWKQSDVAAYADVSQAHLSMLENGIRLPSLTLLERIAKELGMPLWTFFVDEEDHEAQAIVARLLAAPIPDSANAA